MLVDSCELDSLGSPGTTPAWKFMYLFVYSVGPFVATFFVNIAIIVSISRARRRGGQLAGPLHVRFLTRPSYSTREGAGASVEREIAPVVELPTGSCSKGDEESALAGQSSQVIRDNAISN